jgi:cellulose synthase (UDP-forming)
MLAAEMITVTKKDGRQIEGITTKLLEHGVDVYMDELDVLYLGEPIQLSILKSKYDLRVNGTVVSVHNSCNSDIPSVYTVEILDFNGQKDEYVQMLYDRKPTLPQRLRLGEGLFYSLWNNFARRIVIK